MNSRWRAAASWTFRKVARQVYVRYAIWRFRTESRQARSPEEALAFAQSFKMHSVDIMPLQVSEEFAQLVGILKTLAPKRILEIGTSKGGTLFVFSRIAGQDGTLVSVDLPRGRTGRKYPTWQIGIYRSFALENQSIHFVMGDSHLRETVENVRKLLHGQPLDFLFVDGDHSYSGVKMDFETYSKFVRPGGVVGFHDIVPRPPKNQCDVNQFWNEIKERYPHHEIVKDWSQNDAGIGLLFV